MNYYPLQSILEVAKSFAKTRNARRKLERRLRRIEAKKQNILRTEVRTVSFMSLYEAMGELSRCPEKVVNRMLSTFKKLGYQPVKEFDPSTFHSLCLNIHDGLEIVMKDFYYKITGAPGDQSIDYCYEKPKEDGWIPCSLLKGMYCGFRSHDESDAVRVIKVHVTSPFKLGKFNENNLMYIGIDPAAIESMTVVKKQQPKGIDTITHNLTKALAKK